MSQSTPRILLFTGDGKGKTTAALGMLLRAAGHGFPALLLQFLKNDADTGELAALRTFACVETRQAGLGFVPPPASPAFAKHRQAAESALAVAESALASGAYKLVVLDELCGAVALGLLDEAAVVAAVRRAPAGSIVVLTGRNATPALLELADTATEMRCLKHGYQTGHPAQKGVEF